MTPEIKNGIPGVWLSESEIQKLAAHNIGAWLELGTTLTRVWNMRRQEIHDQLQQSDPNFS